jgi:hypothetical protein
MLTQLLEKQKQVRDDLESIDQRTLLLTTLPHITDQGVGGEAEVIAGNEEQG